MNLLSYKLNSVVDSFFKNLQLTPISLLSLSIITVTYYIWTWSPLLAQFGGDNAIYFLSANYLSPYSEPFSVSANIYNNSKYPPLFPLMLGLLGGGDSILVAHIITTTFLLLAILIFYKWMLVLKFNNVHASFLIIVFSIIPGTYFQALSIHSESIYLLFTLLAILFVELYRKNQNIGHIILASVFISCAFMSRSAGVVLVLAFIVYIIINNINRKLLLTIISVLPGFLWGVFYKKSESSYSAELINNYSISNMTSLFQKLGVQLEHIQDAWYSTFTQGEFGYPLLNIFAFICFIGVSVRLYNKKLDGIYVALYLLMISVWPYPSESKRLLFPIIPLLIVQSSLLIKLFSYKKILNKDIHIGNILLESLLLIIMLPTLFLTINRFNLNISGELEEYKRTNDWYEENTTIAIINAGMYEAITKGLIDSMNYVPKDQCVYNIKPSITSLYMYRESKTPPTAEVSDEQFMNSLQESGCQYFYLISLYSPSYHSIFYPLERIGDKLEIIKNYNSSHDGEIFQSSILAKIRI